MAVQADIRPVAADLPELPFVPRDHSVYYNMLIP
jgi:hypothetical protein